MHYSSGFLQMLSSTHCRESFPHWVLEEAPREGMLKVMDIGCGVISHLRWGAIQGRLSITGVDPILDMYALVLARHGLDRLEKLRCDREVTGFAEELDKLVPETDYDVVYTRNALDHTQDPSRALEQMARRVKKGGIVAIIVATREGTRQGWDQLHKTNIFLERGQLMFERQNMRPEPLATRASGLRMKRVVRDSPEWTEVVLEKR